MLGGECRRIQFANEKRFIDVECSFDRELGLLVKSLGMLAI